MFTVTLQCALCTYSLVESLGERTGDSVGIVVVNFKHDVA